MSTAEEILLMIRAAEPHMDKIRAGLERQFGPMIETIMVESSGHEVSAKRARKIRRRGDAIRFSRWTESGKCRYKWLPRLQVAWQKDSHVR
jgi:hypothetical protein